MSQDMLGSLVRAITTVPENRLGIIKDLALKLTGSEGETWEKYGKLFLCKQDIDWGNGQGVSVVPTMFPVADT